MKLFGICIIANIYALETSNPYINSVYVEILNSSFFCFLLYLHVCCTHKDFCIAIMLRCAKKQSLLSVPEMQRYLCFAIHKECYMYIWAQVGAMDFCECIFGQTDIISELIISKNLFFILKFIIFISISTQLLSPFSSILMLLHVFITMR